MFPRSRWANVNVCRPVWASPGSLGCRCSHLKAKAALLLSHLRARPVAPKETGPRHLSEPTFSCSLSISDITVGARGTKTRS